MIRHIVTYKYGDGYTDEQNIENAKRIKEELENCVNTLEGIISLEVLIEPLRLDNDADLMINSLFKDQRSLSIYHALAPNFVSEAMKNRICFDYIVDSEKQ